MATIIGLCGSLRRASFNLMLLHAAVEAAPPGTSIEVAPNRHASKHARSTGHPVIASAEDGERWLYCYPDDAFAEY
jgi:NAD(P)H-dependent FMN reductase